MLILSMILGWELLGLWLVFLAVCGYVEGKSRPMERKPLTKKHWAVISLSTTLVIPTMAGWVSPGFLERGSNWVVFPALILMFAANLVVWMYAPYKLAEAIGWKFRKEVPRLTSE